MFSQKSFELHLVVAPLLVLTLATGAVAQQTPGTSMTTQTASQASAAVAPASASEAMDRAAVAEARLHEAVRRVLVDRAVTDPATDSGQGAARHQVTVVADKGDVKGRARLYIPLGPNGDAQITFAAPLSGGQSATFANATGLAPNVTVNGSVKVAVWSKRLVPQSALEKAVRAAAAITPETVSTLPPERQWLAGLETLRQEVALGGQASAAEAAARVVSTRLDLPRHFARLATPTLAADPGRFYAAVAESFPELIATRWAAYITPGVEATQHSTDYLDEATSETRSFKDTTSMVSFSGGVSRLAEWKKAGATQPLLTPLFYAGVSFRGGDSVKVPDEKNVCRPIGASGALECVTAPVGAPVAANLMSVTLEYRHWAFNQTLGINPRWTFTRQRPNGGGDERRIKTLEVPIYFMHQVKDIATPDVTFGADLAGGVNIGWRDDGTKDGAFVTLFLTKVFGLP